MSTGGPTSPLPWGSPLTHPPSIAAAQRSAQGHPNTERHTLTLTHSYGGQLPSTACRWFLKKVKWHNKFPPLKKTCWINCLHTRTNPFCSVSVSYVPFWLAHLFTNPLFLCPSLTCLFMLCVHVSCQRADTRGPCGAGGGATQTNKTDRQKERQSEEILLC